MTNTARHACETRRKLLDASCRLFAEKGYRGTTIAAICGASGVNIAGVNYHFGGKEKLYQQAWRHAHDQVLADFPPDGGVGSSRPPRERLRGRIRAGLQRGMLGDAIAMKIMMNELANPTGLLREVVEDALLPIRRETQAILREILGPRATQEDIEWCELCVVAPWLHVTHHRQAMSLEQPPPPPQKPEVEAMVDHFTAFALAGIREIRRRGEKSGGGKRPGK